MKRSWLITFGEDMTGWAENESQLHWKVVEILWSLVAFFVLCNMMIAVSSAVFVESREGWLQGDLEVKNEFIL